MLLCWRSQRPFGLPILMIIMVALVPFAGVAGADELFEVRDVQVDETDQTAAAAREKALATGERRAWDQLVQRLADPRQRGPLPEYSAADIGDAIQSFWVSEEKTSTVRYIATLNYNFRPDKVRRLLSRRGVRYSTTASLPVVIVPVYDADNTQRLWDDPNPWRDAWRGVQERGLVPIRLPAGDLIDLSTLSATAAMAGDAAGLSQFQERYGAGASLVTVAKVEPGTDGKGHQLKVVAVRSGTGVAQPVSEKTYPLDGDRPSPQLLQQAALAVAQDLEAAWRRETAVVATPALTSIDVVVPVGSLEDWVRMRGRLEAMPQVERMRVQSLSREKAQVTIVLAGGTDQLASALARQGLALRSEDNTWVLLPESEASPIQPEELPR